MFAYTNRVRFPVRCLQSVREAVGEDFPILVKMNMHDGVQGALELGEAIVHAKGEDKRRRRGDEEMAFCIYLYVYTRMRNLCVVCVCFVQLCHACTNRHHV